MIEDRLESLDLRFRLFGKTWEITPKTIAKRVKKAAKFAIGARLIAGAVAIGAKIFPVLTTGYILYKVGSKIFRAKSKKDIPPNAEPVTEQEIQKMVATGELPEAKMLETKEKETGTKETETKETETKDIFKSPYLYIAIGGVALLTIILLATGKRRR